jgi:ubiquinone/menaquinone biosynthesis C-methylase UbiE
MQLCLLLRALRTSGLPMADAAVVEIGGGYGNMARLVASAYGFRHWTVFDMAFMNRLQARSRRLRTNSILKPAHK